MIRWREGTVEALQEGHAGVVCCTARLSDGSRCTALAYTAQVGTPVPGDRVLLNVSALQRGLGTGGMALIVALPDRLPPDPPVGPGHLVKARYTPTQAMVLGVDEQESPHHDLLREADSLAGLPVIVVDLHSALPAVLAGLYADRPRTRVAYVMTDGGALPLAFSRTVDALNRARWLVGTVTTGQAYGGDLEAVSVHSGLLAARQVLGAHVVVLSQGPGNLGTGTRWGFSGVAAGEALNATHILGGHPVAGVRISGVDPRERHRGISHHSRTAYGRATLVPADLPIPRFTGSLAARIQEQAAEMVRASGGRLRPVPVDLDGLPEALRASPVPLSSMGRGWDQDPEHFLASAAAGRHVAALLLGSAAAE